MGTVLPQGGPDDYLTKAYDTKDSLHTLFIVGRPEANIVSTISYVDSQFSTPTQVFQEKMAEFASWMDRYCPANPAPGAKKTLLVSDWH